MSPLPRVKYCGSITGSVVVRDGETDEAAVARAERTLRAIHARYARRLSDDRQGPAVVLAFDEAQP